MDGGDGYTVYFIKIKIQKKGVENANRVAPVVFYYYFFLIFNIKFKEKTKRFQGSNIIFY